MVAVRFPRLGERTAYVQLGELAALIRAADGGRREFKGWTLRRGGGYTLLDALGGVILGGVTTAG